MVQKKDRDLFVDRAADIHGSVFAIGWRIPIYLARGDRDTLWLSAIGVLDSQRAAAHDDGDTMKGIAVPCGRFPWFQDEALDERRTASAYGRVEHAGWPRRD
jgi:hypothetical protein